MLITFSQTTYQGSGFLHTAPPPARRWTPLPPGISIRTRNIRYGRCCGLAKDIQEVEHSGLDLMSLMETIQMKACYNNRRGYDVMCTAARPSRTGEAQIGKRLGS